MEGLSVKTRDEKIRFLKSYRWLLLEIDATRDRCLDAYESLYDVRIPTLSDMPRGGRPVTMEDRVVKAVGMDEEIDAQTARAKQLRTQIERSIGAMPDPRDRTILKLKYIQGLSFEGIAERIHFSLTHTKRLHDTAIDNFVILGDWNEMK
jgi:DNA-directed RNA polymerase specialized sigma24 family protein